MKLFTLSCILAAGCMQNVYAQQEAVSQTKHEKTHDHYVGVQLNGLIRQVINFNNNTSTTPVNPYLLIYSVNSIKSGWGLRAGVGYNYNSSTVKDGITEAVSKLNDIHARVGIEKRFKLSEKWSAGAGLDGLFNNNDDYTSATVHSFDTTTTITKSKLPTFGGGAMGWIRYSITDRILVGTEASFYYLTGTEDRVVTVIAKKMINTPPFTTFETTSTTTKSEPKFSNGSFTSPVVFFLIVRI